MTEQTLLSVRNATASDIDFIMEVEKSSFINSIQEERDVFFKRIEVCPSLFLILQKDGVSAGYLSAEIMRSVPVDSSELKLGHSPKPFTSISQSDYVYISSFAVLPEFRGNGCGKKFWNLSMDYFKSLGIKKFLLLVNDCWKGAKHIYRESGFSQIEIFKNFFPTEDGNYSDGILMVQE